MTQTMTQVCSAVLELSWTPGGPFGSNTFPPSPSLPAGTEAQDRRSYGRMGILAAP
jgi:hypothetical protein